MKSSLGQGIAVAAIRRQSTRGKFKESQPSPLLLSTQSLEGVVWISEKQRKYSRLFPHSHNYRDNPGDPATYTLKKWNQEKSQQYHLGFFKHQGQDLLLQSLLGTEKPGYSSEQQLCVDGKSEKSPCCMEMAGCVLFYWQHISDFINSFTSSTAHPAWGFLLLVIYQGRVSPTTYILEAIYITIHTCAL